MALQPIFEIEGDFIEKLEKLESWLNDIEIGQKGIAELKEVWSLVQDFGLTEPNLELDITLARGLSYYTGAIFEVKALGVSIGSISGGGRYDNLTGAFGMPGLSGVGISLGVDRIYDVMEELNIFPENLGISTQILITNLSEQARKIALPLLSKLRQQNYSAEIYPDISKLKKQFEYANKRAIPFLIIIGDEEIESELLTIKNMNTGVQDKIGIEKITEFFEYTFNFGQ